MNEQLLLNKWQTLDLEDQEKVIAPNTNNVLIFDGF